jgi:hypothetical protein
MALCELSPSNRDSGSTLRCNVVRAMRYMKEVLDDDASVEDLRVLFCCDDYTSCPAYQDIKGNGSSEFARR